MSAIHKSDLHDAIASQLQAIVSKSAVCAWENLTAEQQLQLSTAVSPETTIDCVVYPQTQAELAAVMTCAYQNQWRVLPCGSGSKLHWGGLAEGINLVASTARLNRLVEHAVGDLTVTVEAGMPFAELQATLAKHGQFLAIDPDYSQTATLGGIVATAKTGSLRQRYGGVRDMLIGLSFVRADGQTAKAGGRVVKNVAGYDLMKLFTGSWGTLGIISQMTFRIYPIAQASQTVVLVGTAAAIAQATQTLLVSALTPIAADLLAPQLIAQLELGQGIGLLAQFRSIAVSVQKQADALIELGNRLGLKTVRFSDQDEATLWQALKQIEEPPRQQQHITCKIGVSSAEAVATLAQISAAPTLQTGKVHAASGLGLLQLEEGTTLDRLLELRNLCQSHNGFLTILEAPRSIKQQMEVWGYSGNARSLMKQIKQQFDSSNLLSPHRFVDGI